MSKGTIKTCPRCGKKFTCFGDHDCWCEHLNIHKKEMLEILETYHDCLCPDCLGKYAE
ncbi:MAG: cysteine-rich CWC family protein [Bacteroidales bacterium]|nr:cysteine-rich CWC family protein [Bacteroidales bacterium]